MSFETLRGYVVEANQQAMAHLSRGEFEESRKFLDTAKAALQQHREFESPSETLSESNASGNNGSPRRAERGADVDADVGDGAPGGLGGLWSMTLNNLAGWWRARGDPGAALDSLGRALADGDELGGVPPQQRAFTHSNLCAVLSQMGKHELALEYAKAAVTSCQEALAAVVDDNGDGTGGGGAAGSGELLGTLAVACHNLAVELEHVDGSAASLPWYEQALAVAERAATAGSSGGSGEAEGGEGSGEGGGASEAEPTPPLVAALTAALAGARRKAARDARTQPTPAAEATAPQRERPRRSRRRQAVASEQRRGPVEMVAAPAWRPRTAELTVTSTARPPAARLLVTPVATIARRPARGSARGRVAPDGGTSPGATAAAATTADRDLGAAGASGAASAAATASEFDFGDFWGGAGIAATMQPGSGAALAAERLFGPALDLKAANCVGANRQRPTKKPAKVPNVGAAETRRAALAQAALREATEATELYRSRRFPGALEGPRSARRDPESDAGRFSPPPASRPGQRGPPFAVDARTDLRPTVGLLNDREVRDAVPDSPTSAGALPAWVLFDRSGARGEALGAAPGAAPSGPELELLAAEVRARLAARHARAAAEGRLTAGYTLDPRR